MVMLKHLTRTVVDEHTVQFMITQVDANHALVCSGHSGEDAGSRSRAHGSSDREWEAVWVGMGPLWEPWSR